MQRMSCSDCDDSSGRRLELPMHQCVTLMRSTGKPSNIKETSSGWAADWPAQASVMPNSAWLPIISVRVL
eukprot:1835094-Pleurochrysis_carterae.AAC.1